MTAKSATRFLALAALAAAVVAIGPDGNETVPVWVRRGATCLAAGCGLCSILIARRALHLLILLGFVAGLPRAQAGVASWYGDELRGRLMANGKPFDPDRFTCASWHYPLGTVLRVTLAGSSRSVTVVVTDRGPARRLRREIDLSRAAFARLAPTSVGLIKVSVSQATNL